MATRSAHAALALLLFGCANPTDSLEDRPDPQPSVLNEPRRPGVTPARTSGHPIFEPIAGERCEEQSPACTLCASRPLGLGFALRSVEISGLVILIGRMGLVPERYGWGAQMWLLFKDTRTDHVYRTRPSDAGEYQIHLFSGEYSVELQATDAQQHQAVTLASLGLHSFEADGSLDLFFSARTLQGEITMNGETMPPDRPDGRVTRGWVRFVDKASGTELNLRLPPEGPAVYSAVLPADRAYDVVWITSGFEDQTPHAEDPLPPGAAVISELSPSDSGLRNFDVQTIEVSGEVTANGATLPDDGLLDGMPRAVLEFRPAGFGLVSRVSLGEQGSGRFSVTLTPGDYEIGLLTGSSANQDALRSIIRWEACEDQGGTCAVQQSEKLNIDIPEGLIAGAPPQSSQTAVEGQVALLGPWKDLQADLAGGEVMFLSRETGAQVLASLLDDGRFSVRAPPGRYDLLLRGRQGRSSWGAASASELGSTPVPLTGVTVLGDGVLIQGEAQTLNLSAEAVHLTGEVLINHELMNANGQVGERGRLELSVASDTEASPLFSKIHLFFGREGPASWSVLILRNRYSARLSTLDSSRGIHPLNQDVLPVGELSLGELDLSASALTRSVLYDVGVHRLQGSLRIEGPLPSVGDQSLGVRFNNDAVGDGFLAEIAASGEEFEVLVFAGEYRASLVSRRWDTAPPFGETSLLRPCAVGD